MLTYRMRIVIFNLTAQQLHPDVVAGALPINLDICASDHCRLRASTFREPFPVTPNPFPHSPNHIWASGLSSIAADTTVLAPIADETTIISPILTSCKMNKR